MFSTWKAVASSGRDEMTMSRSSVRSRRPHSMVDLALLAGSTAKTWSYLFLKTRASFARRPASAAATGCRRLQADGRNGGEIHGVRHEHQRAQVVCVGVLARVEA